MPFEISAGDWFLSGASLFVGFLLTVGWQYTSRHRLQVLFEPTQSAIAIPIRFDGFKYVFQGREIPGFYLCSIYLQSFSNRTIDASMLSKHGELTFFVTDGTVLNASVVGEKLHSKAAVRIESDAKSVTFSFDRIAPDDGFMILMTCDSSMLTPIQCQSYVVGRKKAIRRMKPFEDQFMLVMLPVVPAMIWMMVESSLQFPPPVETTTVGLSISLGVMMLGMYGGAIAWAYEYTIGKKARMRRLKRRFKHELARQHAPNE